MKILIVSDTHGHERNLKKVIGRVGPVDEFIHLGDIEGHEDYIEALVDCPVHMVSGNNDFFSDLPREEIFYLGKYQVMITHGHYYGVSMGTDRLKEEALTRNIDIVMYGHTHKPEIDIEKGDNGAESRKPFLPQTVGKEAQLSHYGNRQRRGSPLYHKLHRRMIKYSYAMAEPAKDKSKIGKNKKYKNKFKKSVDFCFSLWYI